MLTANQDSGPSFTGGSANDTFNALTTTLTTGDNLVGNAGTDTLNLTGTISAATTIAGFTLNSVENVNVSIADGTAGTAHALTLNMANAGAANVTLSGLAATTKADGLVLDNLAAGSTLGMSNATNVDLTANFVAAATAGTADSVAVTLNAVSSTAATDTILTVGAGFESMTVNTTGAASSMDDIVFGGTSMTITGNQNLTVRQALDATLSTINASALTGALSIVTANDATTPDAAVAGVDQVDVSVTGGTGNDTLNLSANIADNEIYVNGGAGNDTVTIGQIVTNASSTTAGDVLVGGDGTDTLAGDVDLFDAGTAGFTGTVTATGISGFEVLSVNGFAAEANTINVANISTDINTVTIASAIAGATTVNFGTAGAYTVNVGGAAAILDGQTLTVDAGGSATTDTLTIANTNAATGTAQIGADDANITTTDFETVTINTGSYSTATAQLMNAINVGTANTLVLTGSNGLTTTATTGIITAGVINASAMTGALTMNVAAASGVTSITGGTAADTLQGDAASSISGGAGNDSITGGTGNDTLNGDEGDDTITTNTGDDVVNGGAGNDTLVFAGNLSALDRVNGGEGTDTLSVTNGSLSALKLLTISEANTFNTNFTGVETLTITDTLDQTTFDLGYLNGLTKVKVAGISGAETLNGFDSGETVELTVTLSNTLTVGVNNAATGTTDVLNVALTNGTGAADDYTDLAIANVETINVTATEATANAADRAATIGLAITQATGGSAQTVNFAGTESIIVDTAIAAGTINASGMTVVADTDTGLTMSTSFTKTTAIAGQAITGSGKVDTLYGSTGSDNISAGAGNDIIHGSTGADTIDGGAGTDTYHTTNLVGANIEGTGTGTSTGVVINLGSTAITNVNVVSTTTTENLSAGLTSVAAGTVAYLFAESVITDSSVVKTLSNIENVTLAGNGINIVVGSDAANSITGGTGVDYLTGGLGADTLNGGAGVDTYVLTETTSSADTVVFVGSAASVQTTDIGNLVTDFAVAADIIDFTTSTAFRHGGAALTGYAEGALGNIGTAVGFQVFSDNITVADAAVGPTEAEMETYFAANEVFFNGGANDAVYVAVDNGTHTWILSLQSGGTGKVFTAADDDGVIVARLTGITDATTLAVTNFVDFA